MRRVSWYIFIKEMTNHIRSRGQGIHCWHACLSLYLFGEIIVGKFCHADKNWDNGRFCLKKKVIMFSFPTYGVTAPKHVAAVLMHILILFLKTTH